MLKLVRKNTKTVVWICIAGMTMFGLGSVWVSASRGALYAGSIFGQKVKRADFSRIYQQVAFGLQNEDLSQAQLEDQTWVRLIYLHEAKKQKVSVTPDQVRAAIRSIPGFQDQLGGFNKQAYDAFIKRRFNGDSRMFEDMIRDDLKINSLTQEIIPEPPTEQAAKERYFNEHRQLNLAYVTFPQANSDDIAQPDEATLQQFYKNQSDTFRRPPEFKLGYVLIDTTPYEASIEVSDQDRLDYYEKNIDQFKKDGDGNAYTPFKDVESDIDQKIKAQRAIFKAQDDAMQIKQKIKTPADMQKVEDAPRVRYIESDYMAILEILKEVGWSAQLFQELRGLEKGNVSNAFRTSRGFVVLTILDQREAHLMDFEEIKEEVREAWLEQQKIFEAQKTAQAALDKARSEGWSIDQLARQYNLDVEETGLVEQLNPKWGEVEASSVLKQVKADSQGLWLGPALVKDGARVFIVKKIQEVEESQWLKDKETYLKELTQQTQYQAFSLWHSNLVQEAKREVYAIKE